MNPMPSISVSLGYVDQPENRFLLWPVLDSLVQSDDYDIDAIPMNPEQLNDELIGTSLDVAIVVPHQIKHLHDKYRILTSGTRLSSARAPIVIGRQKLKAEQLKNETVLLPEEPDVARLLLPAWSPEADIKTVSQRTIIDRLENGERVAGVLRDQGYLESRNTELVEVADLAKWWYEQYRHPVPIQFAVVNNQRQDDGNLATLLRQTATMTLENFDQALEFALNSEDPRSEQSIKQSLRATVGEHTIDLGSQGRESFQTLYNTCYEQSILEDPVNPVFVQSR
jgi:1,4-dihydroxy-6-naphthoate synthase